MNLISIYLSCSKKFQYILTLPYDYTPKTPTLPPHRSILTGKNCRLKCCQLNNFCWCNSPAKVYLVFSLGVIMFAFLLSTWEEGGWFIKVIYVILLCRHPYPDNYKLSLSDCIWPMNTIVRMILTKRHTVGITL